MYDRSHDPTFDNGFMSISSSPRHSLKSCPTAFPPVPFVFAIPKVSSIPNGLTRVGIVHLILYRGGVWCGNDLYSCFGLPRFIHPSSHPLCVVEWDGRGLGGLYVCMYCAGFCMQTKALCTRLPIISVHPRTIVLVHGVSVVRSIRTTDPIWVKFPMRGESLGPRRGQKLFQ